MTENRSMIAYMKSVRRKYNAASAKFQAAFGVSLRSYWDNVTGFDIVKFDENVVKSGENSMEEVVRLKYGDEAVELIKSLL